MNSHYFDCCFDIIYMTNFIKFYNPGKAKKITSINLLISVMW